jgi:hypothetical protein
MYKISALRIITAAFFIDILIGFFTLFAYDQR